jgi:mannose-1-phosphate guanylyltransferase/phosphomannomutase
MVLPTIMGKIGSETMTVNGYVDESRPTMTVEDRTDRRTHLAELVLSSRAHLGALIETTSETLDIVTDGGLLVPRESALLLLADLVSEVWPERVLVVPVSATAAVEAIVEPRGGRVVRARRSLRALLAAGEELDAVFAGTEDGTFAFPSDNPGTFDALVTFCKLHELIAKTDSPLSERAATLPRSLVEHRIIPTGFEQKGTVMREVAAGHDADRVDQTEGLKLFHGDAWALVIPDPEDPVTHLWAEGRTPQETAALADRYASLVAGAAAD